MAEYLFRKRRLGKELEKQHEETAKRQLQDQLRQKELELEHERRVREEKEKQLEQVLKHASPAHDAANVFPTLVEPLPRLTPVQAADHSGQEKYEVVVVGVR